MKKYFSVLLPFFDHLYIFQLLEYEISSLLIWFLKHPSKRNLQRKSELEFTPKAVALTILGLGLILFAAVYTSYNLTREFILTPILFFFYAIFSPIFLVLAQIIIFPIQIYSENKIIQKAKEKISKLNNLKTIAIVGSFAKTSTKNILYTLLWKDFVTVKTPKSYNTAISIARTILSDLKDNTQFFIVEMDAYHKGDIQRLTGIVNPKLGVITAIAAQHLERFGSMEILAKTQFELAENLKKNTGILFLNSTDDWSEKLEKDFKLEKVFYGIGEENNNIFYSNAQQTNSGWEFKLHFGNQTVDIELPLYGAHHIINFLAASSIAIKLGLSLKTIQERASLVTPTEHRLEIKKLGSITLIDNSYNTNPTVSKASLNVLQNYAGSQKILITPGLIELGRQSSKENQQFAMDASKVADEIIIVGGNAREDLLKGLKKVSFSEKKIHTVKDTNAAMDLLSKLTKPRTVVLIENDLPDQYF